MPRVCFISPVAEPPTPGTATIASASAALLPGIGIATRPAGTSAGLSFWGQLAPFCTLHGCLSRQRLLHASLGAPFHDALQSQAAVAHPRK